MSVAVVGGLAVTAGGAYLASQKSSASAGQSAGASGAPSGPSSSAGGGGSGDVFNAGSVFGSIFAAGSSTGGKGGTASTVAPTYSNSSGIPASSDGQSTISKYAIEALIMLIGIGVVILGIMARRKKS